MFGVDDHVVVEFVVLALLQGSVVLEICLLRRLDEEKRDVEFVFVNEPPEVFFC
jgi:hypothetical protein